MEAIRQRKQKIRLIKYTFLITAIVIIIGIVVTNMNLNKFFNNEDIKASQNIKKFKKSKTNHTLSINESIFQGLSKDLSPYKIIAQQVDKLTDQKFNLQTISGDYLINNNKLGINALSGTFDNTTHDITLSGKVSITYQDIKFSTNALEIAIENKEASTHEPVTLEYKNSQIESDSFEIENNAEIINFKGNVRSTINLDDFK